MYGLLVHDENAALAKLRAANVTLEVTLAAVPSALVTLLVCKSGKILTAVPAAERQVSAVGSLVHYS